MRTLRTAWPARSATRGWRHSVELYSRPSLPAYMTSATTPELETRHRHGARCDPTPITTTVLACENSELSTVTSPLFDSREDAGEAEAANDRHLGI